MDLDQLALIEAGQSGSTLYSKVGKNAYSAHIRQTTVYP